MSHTLVSSFQHAGLAVEIHVDEDAQDPRGNDNTAVFALSHKRYLLADEDNLTETLLEQDGTKGALEYLRAECGAVAAKVVYGYDHGSLTCSTTPYSCQWDSGVLGFVFVTAEAMDTGWGQGCWTQDNADACLDAEVEEYAQYLRGEVFGYVVLDNDGETLDSCWGFYGLPYAQEEARSAADSERSWLVSKAEGEAYALLQALETPDVAVALKAALQGVR